MWQSSWTSQPPQSTPHGICGPHPTAPTGTMMTPFVGHQAPHEIPFMVQPAQQGVQLHPNYRQLPPTTFPPQQPHQQALPFPNCNPETTQLCRPAPPQQVLPIFHPQTCPQQQFSSFQAPGTFPVQELPAQSVPMPNQHQFVVQKPTETTPLSTSHHELQVPTLDATGMDLKALQDRLDAALEKKLENMAESLKQSLTSTTSRTPPASSTPLMNITQDTPAPTTSGPTPLQPGEHQRSHLVEVPVKAKPPTPPDLAQQEQQPSGDQPSRNSQRSPLTREKRSSRRSRSRRRRSTHRRRNPSPKTSRQETERRTTMPRSTLDRYPSRPERPSTTSRTSRTEPIDGRRRDHPIYRSENTFRQVHQDANSTVYTNDKKDKTK